MQSPQAKLKEITRLLASWPTAAGEGEEHLRSYLLAVEDYPAGEVEAAITALIKGSAPGLNPSFLPPPAVVGAECRRQLNMRLRSEELERKRRPALPPPDIEHSPDSQARVRELVERAVRGLQVENGEDPGARHRAALRRTNDYFDAERGFTVGDRDGHEDAA